MSLYDRPAAPPPESENVSKQWLKSIAAASGFAVSVNQIRLSSGFGDQLFLFIAAFGTFLFILSELPYGPRYAISLLIFAIRRITYWGCKIARNLLVLVSLIVTAAIIKFAYGLDIFPEYVDPWAKRAAVSLIFLTPPMYFVSLFGRRVIAYNLQIVDRSIISYEIICYVVFIVYSVSITLLFMGSGIEGQIPLSHKVEVIYQAPTFNLEILKLLAVVASSSAVWLFCIILCINSRLAELHSHKISSS